MEVSKLKKMIDDLCLYEEVNIEKTGLIIDGAALYYSLYYTSDPKLDRRCGGDYPGFKDEVCNFFKTLQVCEVTPYVFLDGGSDPDKHKTLVYRRKDTEEKAKTIATTKPENAVPKGCNVLPPLVKDVFIEILKEKGIEFKQCLGEADPEVVSDANQKQCPVLSIDKDFCIFDLCKGFLHLDNFEWKSKKDEKIPAKLYTRSKFCEHFKLDPALMPVFASIAGNDYSRLEDRGRFARQSSSSGEYSIKRLDGMLRFLTKANLDGLNDSQKRERALSQALSHVGKKENKTFKLAIQKYVQPEKPSSKLPTWVRKKVERGELTTSVISVVDQKSMMPPVLVEDFSQRSSYTAAYPIRQYFYKLLTKDVQALLPDLSSDEQKNLRVSVVHVSILSVWYLSVQAPEGLRRRVFEEALQVQTSALENIPDQLKLPVCVTVFWFNNLKLGQKAETVHCLHALLLWFVCDPNSPGWSQLLQFQLHKSDYSVYYSRSAVSRLVSLKALSRWTVVRVSVTAASLMLPHQPEQEDKLLLVSGSVSLKLCLILSVEDEGKKKELYENLKTACNPYSGEGSSQKKKRGGRRTNCRKRSDY
uniref:Asteroid domain-containing protein n=1 Tax=Haplochromis burtoni TaxID=8153 RepID=A0A3Q2WC14_HAPBU